MQKNDDGDNDDVHDDDDDDDDVRKLEQLMPMHIFQCEKSRHVGPL